MLEEHLIPIDVTLRFVMFGLECGLGISLSAAESERVFRDAVNDQVSAKEYVFYDGAKCSVTGRVDEYEADEIWLRVEGTRSAVQLLHRAVESVQYHVLRLRKSECAG